MLCIGPYTPAVSPSYSDYRGNGVAPGWKSPKVVVCDKNLWLLPLPHPHHYCRKPSQISSYIDLSYEIKLLHCPWVLESHVSPRLYTQYKMSLHPYSVPDSVSGRKDFRRWTVIYSRSWFDFGRIFKKSLVPSLWTSPMYLDVEFSSLHNRIICHLLKKISTVSYRILWPHGLTEFVWTHRFYPSWSLHLTQTWGGPGSPKIHIPACSHLSGVNEWARRTQRQIFDNLQRPGCSCNS